MTLFLSRFWGGLFLLLGLSSLLANFLGRVILYTEERTITIATGYITLLLGLATVAAHNLWVKDWRISVTLIGWTTYDEIQIGKTIKIDLKKKDPSIFLGTTLKGNDE